MRMPTTGRLRIRLQIHGLLLPQNDQLFDSYPEYGHMIPDVLGLVQIADELDEPFLKTPEYITSRWGPANPFLKTNVGIIL